jgi:2-haloacid dehalogenase
MIKYILFDVDDTLLDFHASEAVCLPMAFKTVGVDVNEEITLRYKQINRSLWDMYERREIVKEDILPLRFNMLFKEMGIEADGQLCQDVYERELGKSAIYIDGCIELLEKLYGKYKMYLVTNGTNAVQEPRLKKSGISKYFDGIFISELFGCEKPSKEFFDKVFDKIGNVDKNEVIIIGDSLTSDIKGGVNYGLHTCHFNPKGTTGSIKAEYEIKSLYELPELLKSI